MKFYVAEGNYSFYQYNQRHLGYTLQAKPLTNCNLYVCHHPP